jgi:hypothetical protein
MAICWTRISIPGSRTNIDTYCPGKSPAQPVARTGLSSSNYDIHRPDTQHRLVPVIFPGIWDLYGIFFSRQRMLAVVDHHRDDV